MFAKECLVFVSVSLVYASSLKLSVYYESLCPYSREFIANQLSPAFDQFGNALGVDLLPYGLAKASNETGQLIITCQHGTSECYGNKAHACSLDLSSNNSAGIQFIICSMSDDNPAANATVQECAEQSNIAWSSLQECLNSGHGDELLAFYGARTDSSTHSITRVPTIIFNDVYNATLESRARINLPELACELLQDVCNNS